WMGMGQALSEETLYKDGRHIAASVLEYHVPTIIESPDIEVHIVESIDPNGPFGAKEASEGSLASMPPAIVAAVANAIGLKLTELPLTPDRVLDALTGRRRPGARRKEQTVEREAA
ncbi:MAG TPA: 4-hydroxybenzoyl-CoA reductase subunit alpha, partial [Rhodocyclaceae bacterium]|nr:4-hydroxybenzoyl-CoA reductase subunit alpha [Rhodocyclaceae bacterium]